MRKTLLTLAVLAVCVVMAGCIRQQQQLFTTTATFDREMAERQMRPGNNTIKGSALLRQSGGGVVTGAGNQVQLLPFTPYAQDRLSKLYGGTERGALGIGFQGLPERAITTPKAPGYEETSRSTTADAQGFFKFENLADGTYFLTTHVVWEVARQIQGGILMKKVTVGGGETKEVVLTYP